jgi:hypothetical protein
MPFDISGCIKAGNPITRNFKIWTLPHAQNNQERCAVCENTHELYGENISQGYLNNLKDEITQPLWYF